MFRALQGRGPCGGRAPSDNATLADADVVHGSSVVSTSPERTWCDLATVLSLDELIIAGDFVLKRRAPLSSVAKLQAAVARMSGRRGVLKAREALNGSASGPILDQRRWDISRDERIIELGWRVLKLTQLDLNQPHGGGEPSVVSRTRAALIQRGWRRSAVPGPCPGPSSRPVSRAKNKRAASGSSAVMGGSKDASSKPDLAEPGPGAG